MGTWDLAVSSARDVSLVLQDIDVITRSTESTSVLTDVELIGQKKTRVLAAWAERRGFTTSIHERLFDASFTRQGSEPGVALCGLDNPDGRRALDQVDFDLVVEAGLGRGYRDSVLCVFTRYPARDRPRKFGRRHPQAKSSKIGRPIRSYWKRAYLIAAG